VRAVEVRVAAARSHQTLLDQTQYLALVEMAL
jgi:hypothetical protein